ncbi:MAG: helix-turn-helix domain-containing protein [Pseudomonadota bacterium]
MVNLVELRHVVELLDGCAPRRVVDKALRTAELDRSMLNGAKGFIPYAAEAVLVESVARSLGERHLGAKLGAKFDYMTYGAYSVYVLSAPNLATALDRGRRAMIFIHPGSKIVLRQTDTHLVVGRDSVGLTVIGHRHLDEGAPFVISQVAHHFLGSDWTPDWVELPDVRDRDMKTLQDLIGTEIRTDCQIPSVAIRLTDLSALNPGPPESDQPLSLNELEALMGVSPAQSAVDAVEQILSISSEQSVPDEKRAARLLATSPRTLQRALKLEGTTFRDVRSVFVAKRAERLLATTETPINEIARKLGYSEARAFRRAFRKTTGLSPGEFRKNRKSR